MTALPMDGALTEEQAQQAQTLCADQYALPVSLSLNLAPTVTLDLVLVPAGAFRMGDPPADDAPQEAGPLRRVVIPAPFYMSKTAITQGQWMALMGTNPAHFADAADLPVETVNWEACAAFCRQLTAQLGYLVRLPSEAEWEYACRAGSRTAYHFGEDASLLLDYGWHRMNAEGRSHPVAHKLPNPWGLYDMCGGIDEFCQDHWHPSYVDAPTDGSAWIAGGDAAYRVLRGGSWYDRPEHCRSANRNYYAREIPTEDHGFRVVVEVAVAQSSSLS